MTYPATPSDGHLHLYDTGTCVHCGYVDPAVWDLFDDDGMEQN